jgi:hypothetical protein
VVTCDWEVATFAAGLWWPVAEAAVKVCGVAVGDAAGVQLGADPADRLRSERGNRR